MTNYGSIMVDKMMTEKLKKGRFKQFGAYQSMIALWSLLFVMGSFQDITLAPPGNHPEWNLNPHSFVINQQQLLFSYLSHEKTEKTVKLALNDHWIFKEVIEQKQVWHSVAQDWNYKISLFQSPENKLQMELKFRLLLNDDLYVFMRIHNTSPSFQGLQYALAWTQENAPNWNSWASYGFLYPSDASNAKSPILTSIQASEDQFWNCEMRYFKTFQHEHTIQTWLKGKVFQYKPVEPGLIEHQEVNSLVWLDIVDNVVWNTTRSWISPQSIYEDWFLFSDKALLNINSSRTKKVMETTDFSLIKYFGQNGFYYNTQSTGYLNENHRTYYWDYSMYAARSILEYYFNPHERYFYDFATHCLLVLKTNRNEKGYWKTGTVSLWLNELYQLEANYFDTRFSVDAGLFLLFYHQRFHCPEALAMATKIGDLLLTYMQKGYGFRTPNDGMMIQDYICENNPDQKTHTSLNHLINEANFLLMLYEHSQVVYYKNAAIRIVKGIIATEEEWKNSLNGDLHYALFPDATYGEKDYLTLTYHDLLRYHSFSEKYLKERTPAMFRLGKYKEDFLIHHRVIDRRRLQENKTHVYHLWEKPS